MVHRPGINKRAWVPHKVNRTDVILNDEVVEELIVSFFIPLSNSSWYKYISYGFLMVVLCFNVGQYVTVGFTWWLGRIVDSEEYTLCLFSDNSRPEKATSGPLTAKLILSELWRPKGFFNLKSS